MSLYLYEMKGIMVTNPDFLKEFGDFSHPNQFRGRKFVFFVQKLLPTPETDEEKQLLSLVKQVGKVPGFDSAVDLVTNCPGVPDQRFRRGEEIVQGKWGDTTLYREAVVKLLPVMEELWQLAMSKRFERARDPKVSKDIVEEVVSINWMYAKEGTLWWTVREVAECFLMSWAKSIKEFRSNVWMTDIFPSDDDLERVLSVLR